jgi:hypothetical protein
MPNRYLAGNGRPCPACALRRALLSPWRVGDRMPCNRCDGSGRLAFSACRIVLMTRAAARRIAVLS